MKLIAAGALSFAVTLLSFSYLPSAGVQAVNRQQTKEASVPPQGMTVEDEADAPVRLNFLAAWTVPEHKHLTELEFVPQNVSAKPIKAYTVRVRETWQDAQSGEGRLNHTCRTRQPRTRKPTELCSVRTAQGR